MQIIEKKQTSPCSLRMPMVVAPKPRCFGYEIVPEWARRNLVTLVRGSVLKTFVNTAWFSSNNQFFKFNSDMVCNYDQNQKKSNHMQSGTLSIQAVAVSLYVIHSGLL